MLCLEVGEDDVLWWLCFKLILSSLSDLNFIFFNVFFNAFLKKNKCGFCRN